MKRVVVVIPAFNEARLLPQVLEGLRKVAGGYEVVVIDDGSSDDTAHVAASAGARVLRHAFNLGYGAALQTGYKYAQRTGADVVVQMDGDTQHDPSDLPRLIEPVLAGDADLVLGSRFLAGPYRMGVSRSIGRWLFQGVSRVFGLSVSDPTTGLQAMNRRVIDAYVEDFFPADYPDVDVLIEAHRRGLRIRELPAAMTQSRRASSLHHGFTPFYYVFKMLLSIWATTTRKHKVEVDT